MNTANNDNPFNLMSYPDSRRLLLALDTATPLPEGIVCDTGTAEQADDLTRLARARLAEGYVHTVGTALTSPGQHHVYIYFRRPGQR